MDVSSWLAHATADAEARGLPQLKPLLESLARSMQSLRDAEPEFGPPGADSGAHSSDHDTHPTGHDAHSTDHDAGNDQAR